MLRICRIAEPVLLAGGLMEQRLHRYARVVICGDDLVFVRRVAFHPLLDPSLVLFRNGRELLARLGFSDHSRRLAERDLPFWCALFEFAAFDDWCGWWTGRSTGRRRRNSRRWSCRREWTQGVLTTLQESLLLHLAELHSLHCRWNGRHRKDVGGGDDAVSGDAGTTVRACVWLAGILAGEGLILDLRTARREPVRSCGRCGRHNLADASSRRSLLLFHAAGHDEAGKSRRGWVCSFTESVALVGGSDRFGGVTKVSDQDLGRREVEPNDAKQGLEAANLESKAA